MRPASDLRRGIRVFDWEGEIAHNSAMWFLADFGIVGLTALLGFLGWFLSRGGLPTGLHQRGQALVLGLLLAHTAMFGLAMGMEPLSAALVACLGADRIELLARCGGRNELNDAPEERPDGDTDWGSRIRQI
jgi:hypothetical protein